MKSALRISSALALNLASELLQHGTRCAYAAPLAFRICISYQLLAFGYNALNCAADRLF